MKLDEVRRRRLFNHHLAGEPVARITDVLGEYGAMQAQEYAEAKWSLGQRAASVRGASAERTAGDPAGARATKPTDAAVQRGLKPTYAAVQRGPKPADAALQRALKPTDAAVQRAYDDGAVLRTHMLRPTWHFVLPADLRWIQTLTGPRVHVQNGSIYRKNELDGLLHARVRTLLEEWLAGGRAMTRQEIAASLARHGIEAAGQRLAYIVMHAELEAVLCSGPSKGKQRTYALVEERAPRAAPLERDEALAELTRRYFRSHGPATVKDFTWWSSLTVADAKRGLDIVGGELARATDATRTYWFADATLPAAARTPTAHLIQGYDEYVVAYRQTRDVFYPVRSPAAGPQPPFTHALLLDGRLIGHWRFVPGTGTTAIVMRTYEPLKRREQRALDAARARYETFLGTALRVE
jgi:hypothetical protein